MASFNIKVFGDTKMSNQTVVSELVDIFQRYDMIAVQEIKDIDEEVPYLFLDELNKFNNPENILAHQETTGTEIYNQIKGNIDDKVA